MLNNPAARKVVSGVIEPTARLLLRMHISPDAVTIVGTLATVTVALVCLPQGWFVAAVLIIAVLAMSDLLDGTMARLSGTSGPWGNFLDATLDRFADGAVFGGLALYGAFNDQPWITAAALLALVMGQVTSYAKARAEAVGATANVGIAERAERLLIVGAAVLLAGLGVPYVLPAALWILGGLGLITVAQRVATVRRQLHPGSGSLGD
ncbi:MAG: CDP-alcohol phosphatidyltransferase family protein [Candidatus Nanopelagicales bacterium]|nr:CDP-alcohol phosphatidyltransferase family protein [Candidatus Nanopelagicales bacterium]MCF8537057.1 CDP-alcohol phosphatidyltransferase family protein [Candidatus Nanopelagicales bacterium]MCF8542084.1 CDP-alcohol phosphatidyltransferase family protein [Candidatus Nanopelagicales bacterium]MCF8556565.1 CDP-alcohol phosphatidyltransferase family protein [Candidatus Nanopelagicales bacterium]